MKPAVFDWLVLRASSAAFATAVNSAKNLVFSSLADTSSTPAASR